MKKATKVCHLLKHFSKTAVVAVFQIIVLSRSAFELQFCKSPLVLKYRRDDTRSLTKATGIHS